MVNFQFPNSKEPNSGQSNVNSHFSIEQFLIALFTDLCFTKHQEQINLATVIFHINSTKQE